MMFYGLDAFVHGAVAALLILVPATLLVLRATAPMRGGPRATRAAVMAVAAYGTMLLGAGGYGYAFERPEYRDETMLGGAVGGAILTALLFVVLVFALPRRAPDAAP